MAAQGARVQLEDWSALPLYLLPEHWQMLQTSSTAVVLRAQEVLDWSIRLGLRHPSEGTLAMITRLVSLPVPMNEETRPKLHQTLQTVKSVAKNRLLRARLAGVAPPVQLLLLPDNTAHFPPQVATQFFPNGFTPPALALADLRADARLVPLRCTNGILNQGFSRGAGSEQAVRQLVQVMQTAMGQACPVEPELPNFQLFPRQQSGPLAAVAQPPQSQLQSLLQAAARPAQPAATPLLALTDGPAPEVVQVATQPSALAESTPAATPANQERELQEGSLQQQAVPPKPESQQPPSAVSGAGAVAASLQVLAAQHYGAELPDLSAESGVPDPAPSKPAPGTSGEGRGKGGRGKGRGKKQVQPTVQKASTEPAAMRRPAAAAQKKRPAASRSSNTLTVEECRRLRPSGCSKCRRRPGCCPSCWRGRGMVVI